MNKRSLIFGTLILLFAFNANAQLLWKVSGNGLSKPSYIFGTHHLIDKAQIKSFDKVLATCLEADAVVGELDLGTPNMQGILMQAGLMKDTLLKDLLSPTDYELADSVFKQLIGAGMAQLSQLKPMFLTTMYTVMVYLKENGHTAQPQAVDIILQNEAKAKGKAIIGLETVEQQADILFNSMPLKRQAEVMMHTIKNKEEGIKMIKQLNEFYLVGDMDKMEQLNSEDNSSTPEEKRILIDYRNASWIKQLPELMKKQSCFIAVGALHLAGEAGLVKELKKAGYNVEPIALN